MDLFWPDDLVPSRTDIQIIDSVGRFTAPLNGLTQTIGRPGSRLRMSMSIPLLKGRPRAQLQALIAGTRGGTHAIWSRDHSYVQAGSFSGAELLANNTFASGIGSWTSGSEYTLSVHDGVLRATRNAVTAIANLLLSGSLTVAQYAPYVARAIAIQGRGAYASGFHAFGSTSLSQVAQPFGMLTNSFVTDTTSSEFRIRDQQSSSVLSGDYVQIPWVSFARCALVDNGANYLRHTEDMTENPSFWPLTEATLSGNATAAPDGRSVADSLVESSATSAHYTQGSLTLPAAAGDYCFAIALKAGSRSFARLALIVDANSINTYVNLTTGALGANAAGASWSNLRRFVIDLGNGWWYVAMVGRKTSAGTAVTARIQVASADGTDNYAGNGSGNIYIWRPTVAPSGVPVRLVNNGGTANADGDLQSLGGGIYTKGWPASTNDLLKIGDQVQIGGQLLFVTAPVNSDAAGMAFLPLPMLRKAPVDNDPVIVTRPMGKFIPEEPENGWSNMPGIFSDSELVLTEVG